MLSSKKFVRSLNFRHKHRFLQCLRLSTKSRNHQVEEIKIPVPWGHVAGKWWGDQNQIPVLALHGWQDNANTFDKLIPHLSLSSVLAIDLPGHGFSSHFPEGKPYDFQEYLLVLHRIMKHFKWECVPLMAHSLGGAVAFAYTSIFPDKVKWLACFECARSLLTMHRLDPALSFSTALNALQRIEKQKKEISAPAYQLSQMVQMTVEGSLGSIASPESALTLLKRGTHLVENPTVKGERKGSLTSDMKILISLEKKASSSFPKGEREKIEKYYAKILQNMENIKEELKNFVINEEDNKFYIYSRDPIIKIQPFQSFNDEFLLEAAKNIKRPVLSVRAADGFLHGSSKSLYEQTLSILEKSSPYSEYHEIEGAWWGSKNERPIVCLHGWQDNANSFKTLIPLLSSDYSYLAIDLPGHGLSSPINPGILYLGIDSVSLLVRLQRYFNWPKISLLTHSYGAATSFVFSSLFPNNIDLFIAIDLLKPTSWNSKKHFQKLSRNAEKVLKCDFYGPETTPMYSKTDLLKRTIKGSDNSLNPESVEILLERGAKKCNEFYQLTRDSRVKTILMPYFSQKELLKLASFIKCNVLYIKAKNAPFYEIKENVDSVVEIVKKNAKHFEHHILPGTHHLHLNTPEVVAPVINSFFNSIGFNKDTFKL